MTDTLISFETAKLAKEKGFDINQLSKYTSNGKIADRVFDFDNYCEAPTQSLLQKWLRDVHQLLILIDVDTIFSEFIYSIWKISSDEEFELVKEDSNYNLIYEDALEQALIEALKLINNDNTTKS